MATVTVREISRHFTKHAKRALQGEEIIVVKDGKPLVRLTSQETPPKKCPPLDLKADEARFYGDLVFPKVEIAAFLIKSRK